MLDGFDWNSNGFGISDRFADGSNESFRSLLVWHIHLNSHIKYYSHDEVLGRLEHLVRERGGDCVPAFFHKLRRLPAMLEGTAMLLGVNADAAEIGRNLWIQAAAIATATRGTEPFSLHDGQRLARHVVAGRL